ncbi:manganese efflux pump MntP family protein [Candidatus Latescibacterota bacterium]
MGSLTILIIAVGLAMDAFAVSVAVGIKSGNVTNRQTFRLAFHFGFFQFIMPVLGWVCGYAVENIIAPFDHWVACGLLTFIGGKMILESFKNDIPQTFSNDPTRGLTLLGLSVATSIDAFAVGLSLGVLNRGIWYPSIIIGLVAAAFTVLGLELGKRIGLILSKKMEFAGGVILIGIGIKIVLDHTVFAA